MIHLAREPNPERRRAPVVRGRDAELALLAGSASALSRGVGGMVVLTGPAGIGKTSLARAFVAQLPRSVSRASGSPFGHIQTPALWPWRQVARSLSRSRPGGGASALVAALNDLPDPAELADLAIVERTVDLVLDEALRAPLVVVLDDLHRCDDLTLAVLDSLSEQLATAPLLVVASGRATAEVRPGVTALIGRLQGRERVQVLPVSGLPAGPLGDLVRETLAERDDRDTGGPVDDQTVAQIVQLSAGNPLLALEFARARSARTVRAGREPASDSATLAQLVAERIAAVDPGDVLGALALLGRPATISLLAAASRQPGHAVQRVLDRAVAAGLVVVEGVVGRVRFAHPIFADSVADQLDVRVAQRLHRRLAELVETGSGSAGPQVVERARHLIAAGQVEPTDESQADDSPPGDSPADDSPPGDSPPGDSPPDDSPPGDEATALACLAAALYEESVGALDAADDLVAYGLDSAADPRTRVLLLRTRGRCHGRGGRLVAAREHLSLAVEAARGHPDRRVFADAVVDLATVDAHMTQADASRIRLIQEALDLDETDGPARAVLLARLSECVYFSDLERSRTLAQQAVETAVRCGDAVAESLARQAWVNTAMHLGGIEEVEQAARSLQAYGPSGRVNVVGVFLGPGFARGDRVAVDHFIATASRGAAPLPVVRGKGLIELARLSLAVCDGDGEAVARLVASVASSAVSDIQALALPLALVWRLHSGQDVTAAAAGPSPSALPSAVPSPELGRIFALAAASIRVIGGDPAAVEWVRGLAQDRADLLKPRPDLARDTVSAVVAMAGYALRDEELCRASLRPFEGHGDHFVLFGANVLIAPVGWVTALAHAGLGESEVALNDNAMALAASRRFRADTWIAQCLLQRAELLPVAEPAAARACATQARDIAERRGLTLLASRATAMLGALRPVTDVLSAVQTEVLSLAATGLTNEQIARSMYVSVSTVERQFTQLYRRLGVRNRMSAVRWFNSQEQ